MTAKDKVTNLKFRGGVGGGGGSEKYHTAVMAGNDPAFSPQNRKTFITQSKHMIFC